MTFAIQYPFVGPSTIENSFITSEPKSFYDNLNTACELFNEFDRVPDGANKFVFTQKLQAAFSTLYEIKKVDPTFFKSVDNLDKIANLFFLLGRLDYGSKMENARRYFQASVLLKLQTFGLSETNVLETLFSVPTPEALQNYLAQQTKDFSALTDLPEKILSALHKENVLAVQDKTKLFEFSCALRWMGHACQNISDLRSSYQRFECIYGLACICNQHVIDFSDNYQTIKNALWEMAELFYNADRFLHDFEHPHDARGKIALLDNVKPYLEKEGNSLRAITKLAQIYNIQAIELVKIATTPADVLNCYMLSSQALSIAEKTSGFDPFLLNMFRNNQIAFALKAQQMDIDVLSNQLEKVLEYSQLNPHFYNSIYYLGAARLLLIKGDKKGALNWLNKVDQIADSSPDKEDILASSQKLRDEILTAI